MKLEITLGSKDETGMYPLRRWSCYMRFVAFAEKNIMLLTLMYSCVLFLIVYCTNGILKSLALPLVMSTRLTVIKQFRVSRLCNYLNFKPVSLTVLIGI